jgi:hypothetical protein
MTEISSPPLDLDQMATEARRTLVRNLLIAFAVALALNSTGYLVAAAVYGWETANALPLWAPLLVFALVPLAALVSFRRAILIVFQRPLLGELTRLELGRSEDDIYLMLNHELLLARHINRGIERESLTASELAALKKEKEISRLKIEVLGLALGWKPPPWRTGDIDESLL